MINLSSQITHDKEVWSCCFSPDGKLLVTCGSDRKAKIWSFDPENPKTPLKLIQTLEKHSRTVRNAEFSGSGKYLALAGFDKLVTVWECEKVSEGDSARKYTLFSDLEGHENEVKDISWWKDEYLATCGRDRTVWIWESGTDVEFDVLGVIKKHTQDVKSVCFHPKFCELYSSSFDDTICRYKEEKEDWICVDQLEGHSGTVWKFDFHKSGLFMASVGDDKSMIIWKLRLSKKKLVWDKFVHLKDVAKRTIMSVSWGGNGRIAFCSQDNNIYVYELREGLKWDQDLKKNEEERDEDFLVRKHVVENAHIYDVNCVKWHPTNPKILASCGDDRELKIWEL